MLAFDVSACTTKESYAVYSLFVAKLARERDLVVALDVLDLQPDIHKHRPK